MKKILPAAGILCLLLFLSWYFFIKQYDYLVRFTVKAAPGTVYEIVQTLATANKNIDVQEFLPFSEVNQRLTLNDSLLKLHWEFEAKNDSLTLVKLYVKDSLHSRQNKMAVLLTKSVIGKISKSLALTVRKDVEAQLAKFKIKIDGEANTPSTFCACTTISSFQEGKAQGMMQNNYLVSDFLYSNQLKLTGKPFIEVTRWDLNTTEIRFNFCFPTEKKDSLPVHEKVFFKQTESSKALKATYNGNYMFSDNAWYALYQYAENHQLNIDLTPTEVYFNSPNNGSDDSTWTTEIYLPLKQ